MESDLPQVDARSGPSKQLNRMRASTIAFDLFTELLQYHILCRVRPEQQRCGKKAKSNRVVSSLTKGQADKGER